MEDAAIRWRRRILFNLLSATDHAKITLPTDAEMLDGRTTLLNVIHEEEAGSRTPSAREQGRAMRVSLMMLFALGEKLQVEEPSTAASVVPMVPVADEEGAVPAEENMLCCVCMIGKKGASLIPCGHTFCRLCSRALVTGWRSCPLCDEGILDVLDIF